MTPARQDTAPLEEIMEHTAPVTLPSLDNPDKSHDNVVLRWNDAALAAIRVTHPGPTIVARALAILHTCIFDAWAAYDPHAIGTRLGGFLRRPTSEATSANKLRVLATLPIRPYAICSGRRSRPSIRCSRRLASILVLPAAD